MTNCWSEGALRAYLDRELPAADMKAVAAHLGECSACDGLCAELAGRAARVFSLLEMLPEPKVAAPIRATPTRSPSRWLWPGAAVALAAGLAIASIVVQKRENPTPVAQTVVPQESTPTEPVTSPATRPAAVVPTARPAVAKVLRPKRAATPEMDYFVALDDQPIESGVIMRMAIQPGNAQADIVVDPAGRPRAIRLVSHKQ
ncbi:MAG TPA: zf-HC2 domain-containing protein [Candidatus Acidoferrum sp.]|nr:zf-HC2 domain-containing protein [Candidatus Acidoferrum sp.]